jgi:RNA polymerase sigma factor for flagellar operon FliA
MAARVHHQVDVQDLVHAGVLGLLDALNKYDSSRGTQLKTYAEFRIRGAILDELRAMDWASRSTRKKIKRLKEAYGQLERELQQAPSEEQVAQSMGLEMEEFHNLVTETRGGALVSMDELYCPENKRNGELQDWSETEDPHDSYVSKEMRSKMVEALRGLSERERLVITLYYYEELTMREIGSILGVTESRVSQIHAQVLPKLRATLRGIQ